MPNVNPDILRWARETAGLTLEEAAEKLSIRPARGRSPVERLADLETGDVEPTRPMLVQMAKQYRRPLLTFYLSEPPRRGDRGQDFRTLPTDQSAVDEGLLDALIRDVQARQGLIRAVLEEEDEAEPVSFVDSCSIEDGVPAIVEAIRETLPVDLDEFRSEASAADAFALLRQGVEAAGVYVLLMGDLGSYHTAIDLQTFRGFALADDIAPFIVINDRDSKAAWSFTLLHELTHLFLGQTGVSGRDAALAIEQFCNDVASEYLLPHDELRALRHLPITDAEVLQTAISDFAGERNISSSMVAYRLYRAGFLNRRQWQELSQAFRQRWMESQAIRGERARAQEGGPSYYVVKRYRLGTALIESVRRMLRGGELTTSKAGKVLGVKPQQVQALVEASHRDQPQPSA
jgi:Zn-dependent peptidase ImmA (M78 family)